MLAAVAVLPCLLTFLQENTMVKPSINIIILIALLNFSCYRNKTNQNNNTSSTAKPQGIHAAFYNSNGSKIALSTDRGKLYVTDDTFGVLGQVDAHEGNATSSFFSLNDKFIITGGKDKLLKIWQADNLLPVKSYNFNLHAFTSVYGYNTIAACGRGGKVILFNISNNIKQEITLEKEGAYFLYYIEPDSALLISSALKGFEVSVASGAILHQYKGHTRAAYCIMPAHSKKLVVTASADSVVRVFDRYTEKLIYKSAPLDGQAFVATFGAADKVIAASTSSGSIYIFDTTLSNVLLKIAAFSTRVNTIHFSPDGTKILAGSEGGGAKIFSSVNGELLHEFKY